MHEFSIALNIVDIAVETAKANNAEKINEVEIERRDVSGVMYEALELALQSAVKGTMLEKTRLNLKRIRAQALCHLCRRTYTPDNLVSLCPECGSIEIDIISGKEMRVKSINID